MSQQLIPVSPLSLNQLTRDYWGQYDPTVIAQLAQLANDPCYTQKFYKAPEDSQDVFVADGYVTYGMRITPGSLIYGVYLPMLVVPGNVTASAPGDYTVQITDVELQHDFTDIPISSLLVSNFKPTFQSTVNLNMGSFPYLFTVPHPSVGNGQFNIKIQETSGSAQRIQFILGVMEACSAS